MVLLSNGRQFEEGDGMDWYEDDEMRKQWEEVSRGEEKIRQRKIERNALHIEAMQRAPALVASQLTLFWEDESRRD